MTEISLLQAELLLALIWLICRIVIWVRQRRIDWKREAVLLLMYVNLAVILRFVFFPMSRMN
ncbi:MAG: VanZ family protein, partial [Oscillospiraceae bacterium]|nr:VanZ family protein [Oscillospiraceae bacterium]